LLLSSPLPLLVPTVVVGPFTATRRPAAVPRRSPTLGQQLATSGLKGIGVNAKPAVTYAIPPGTNSSRADLGLDDSACASTVRLEIALDNFVVGVSGLPSSITKTTPTIAVTVNVTGKAKLKLSVFNPSTTSNCDHFDWANARFIR
jgi:hypothetical protein